MADLCPWCGSTVAWRASVDSDDRIHAKWRACERGVCTYDERYDGPPVQQIVTLSAAGQPEGGGA